VKRFQVLDLMALHLPPVKFITALVSTDCWRYLATFLFQILNFNN